MYIVNKLSYEKRNKKWQHTSTRLMRTFPDEKHAIEYLEKCYMINTYLPHGKEEYIMEQIGL
jgi:hypothetical protein